MTDKECYVWLFNTNPPENGLAKWFYDRTIEEIAEIKKEIFEAEGKLDCHTDFPEALRRWRRNKAIEAIIK